MLAPQLDDVDEALLMAVCAEHWPESQTLEFKRALPANDAAARVEFLKDVCALANAGGGDLAFGVRERNATADALNTIQGVQADAVTRHLTHLLEAIEPRIAGIRMRPVNIPAGGFVLIVRVPESPDRPHCFWPTNDRPRFVYRNGTQTSTMNYGQLRAAFDRSAILAERAYQFRQDRIAAIIAGRAWQPMQPGPLVVVHLVPMSSMARGRSIAIESLYDDGFARFALPDAGAIVTRTFNLDGLVVHPGQIRERPTLAYTQIFRSGCLETVRWAGHARMGDNIIPSTVLAVFVRERTRTFLAEAVRLGLAGPTLIGASLLNVDGVWLGLGDRYGRESAQADRAHLVVPETLVERIDAVADPDTVARPLLDTFWQSFDERRCLEFDADGRWVGPADPVRA
jgi:hypothetical protein